MQKLFDLPEEYDTMLEKGISATGNDKKFFIKGRLDHILNQSAKLDSVRTILDFGCGTGETSNELAKLFPKADVLGSDLSENAIRYASQKYSRHNLRFVTLADIPPTTFDLIYLNGVIHHIALNQRFTEVQTLFRLSHPGTRIWIFENNPFNPGTQWAMYSNPFDKGVIKISPSQLQKLMIDAGFKPIQTDFLFYFPQFLSWLRPLEKYLIRFPFGGQYGVLAQKL